MAHKSKENPKATALRICCRYAMRSNLDSNARDGNNATCQWRRSSAFQKAVSTLRFGYGFVESKTEGGRTKVQIDAGDASGAQGSSCCPALSLLPTKPSWFGQTSRSESLRLHCSIVVFMTACVRPNEGTGS